MDFEDFDIFFENFEIWGNVNLKNMYFLLSCALTHFRIGEVATPLEAALGHQSEVIRKELQTFWSRRVCSCGGVQDPGQGRRVWSRVGVIL